MVSILRHNANFSHVTILARGRWLTAPYAWRHTRAPFRPPVSSVILRDDVVLGLRLHQHAVHVQRHQGETVACPLLPLIQTDPTGDTGEQSTSRY